MYNRIKKRFSLNSKLVCIQVLKNYKKFIPEKQILIFSDPRGGSTWLAEMMLTIPDTTIIWEPLNIKYVKQFRKLGFGWRQFIPEDASWPEAMKVFKNVLSGKVINEWTALRTGFFEYQKAEQLIIKFCRGNMLLPWLTRQFNFSYLPVYLVRHPFAVVNSQLKQGGWDHPFEKFEVPVMHFNEVYKDHEDFLESLTSKEEILTAHWCIANSIPLNHKDNNTKWITVLYENLFSSPEKEVNRIFNRWEIPVPSDIHTKYRQKSSTTIVGTNIHDIEFQLSRWKHELSSDRIVKMNAVLEYYGIQQYNSQDVMPKINFE